MFYLLVLPVSSSVIKQKGKSQKGGYFSNRHQILKVGDKFSKCQKISQACQKAPSLASYFSILFTNDHFFLLKLLHYADSNAILQTKILIF